jgi:hypothetical protein
LVAELEVIDKTLYEPSKLKVFISSAMPPARGTSKDHRPTAERDSGVVADAVAVGRCVVEKQRAAVDSDQ